MLLQKISPLLLCLMLAACAMGPSPEDKQMADALCGQGKTLLASAKYADARDIYASATTRDDQSARAWNGLGVSYDMLGKRNEALDAYQHAVDLAPEDVSAVNNLAHLYIEMGQGEEAIKILAPYIGAPNAPPALRQNLDAARTLVMHKEAAESDVYADLGSYPTEGMAQGHLTEARQLLNDSTVNFTIVPEVKIAGGTPSFAIRATGRSPQTLCDKLMDKAFPCVAHGY